MGRDVSNYVLLKSKKLDLRDLVKNYIDQILDETSMMIYGGSFEKNILIRNYLNKDLEIYREDIPFIVGKDFIIFYVDTRKCDLDSTLEEFIKLHSSDLDVAVLLMYDGESGYFVDGYDYIRDCTNNYEDNDDIDGKYQLSANGVDKFILDEFIKMIEEEHPVPDESIGGLGDLEISRIFDDNNF